MITIICINTEQIPKMNRKTVKFMATKLEHFIINKAIFLSTDEGILHIYIFN